VGGYLQSRTGIRAARLRGCGPFGFALSVAEQRVLHEGGVRVPTKAGYSIRASYNRAFSTPTALNYFLDISGGVAPEPLGILSYSGRA
jgi:hypothetical protein